MPPSLKAIALTFLLAVFFAGAYGQWPLYSSNQNTYFLTGIALAQAGPLQQDWLVNCTNHIPVFSAYVFSVIEWLSPDAFYFAHAALVALYALCLIWLIRRILKLPQSSPVLALSLLLLTFMHADFVATALNRTNFPLLGIVSSFIKRTTEGVAGQAMLRHFHQPSAFGVFLLISICAFLSGKRRIAAVLAGIAPCFHASYFLPAALLICVYIFIDCRERRPGRAIQTGLLALLVVSPALLYTLINFAPTSAEIASRANKILIYERFPHHADPHIWFGVRPLFQLAWTIAGLVIARRNKNLFTILVTLLVAACSLTLLQVLTKSETLAMLLPWRLFVLLVPISSALLIGTFVRKILSRTKWIDPRKKTISIACYTLMAGLFITGIAFTIFPIDRGEYPPGLSEYPAGLVEYVSTQCDPGDTFLIPPNWQWFRLATRRPIFVDWKSHPYRDTEVLEWYERIQHAKTFYDAENSNHAEAALTQIQEHARITHVVAERETKLPYNYIKAKLVFDDGKYRVYKFKNNESVEESNALDDK